MESTDRLARKPHRILPWAPLLLSLVLLPACTSKTVQQGSQPIQGSTFQYEQAKATSRLLEGDLDGAEEGYRRAEEMARSDAEKALARSGLGGVALQRGNYEEADALLEEAIKKEPRTTDAWIFFSESKMAQGDTLAAISALKEARLQTEGNPEIEAYLGLLHLDWGAPVQAAMYLERALEKAPNRAVWLDALRRAQEEAGLMPTAAEESAVADSTSVAADSTGVLTAGEGEELIAPGAAVAGAAAAGAQTIEPSNELLNRYRKRADALTGATALTRIDLAVLLTVNGPPISPWPGLGDLPQDVREHEYAEAAGVALFAGWMQRFPDGQFYPDDSLSRAQAALLIYPQIRRYPALARRARLHPTDPADVPQSHYAYLEISAVVASGLMELDGAGNFLAEEPLSGAAGDHMARHLALALERGLSGFEEDDVVPPAGSSAP
jgi:tetratricopeptide (TPR) repeat protein